MPTYPASLKIAPRSLGGGSSAGGSGTQDQWRDPVLLSVARSGSTRMRRLASTKKRVWQVSHVMLTATEKTTLETFYDANRAATFTFGVLGTNYTVMFGAELQWDGLSGALWNVMVTLVEA